MIVAMQERADEAQIQQVIEHLVKMGFEVHRSTGARMTVLGAVGSNIDFDIRILDARDGDALPGIHELFRHRLAVGLSGDHRPLALEQRHLFLVRVLRGTNADQGQNDSERSDHAHGDPSQKSRRQGVLYPDAKLPNASARPPSQQGSFNPASRTPTRRAP